MKMPSVRTVYLNIRSVMKLFDIKKIENSFRQFILDNVIYSAIHLNTFVIGFGKYLYAKLIKCHKLGRLHWFWLDYRRNVSIDNSIDKCFYIIQVPREMVLSNTGTSS